MRGLIRRLVQLAVVVVLVTLFTSFLIALTPGDPVVAIAGFGATKQQQADVRQDLGLDKPFLERYVSWLGKTATGDLGNEYSISSKDPVWDRMKPALPVNLSLMLYALLITLLFAIPLGVLAAYKAGTWIDKTINTFAFGAISLPDFALALVLVYLFAVQRQWLPSGDYVYASADFGEHLKHMALPAISLAIGQIAGFMRLLRSDMVQVLQEDFILMAKAKGMPARAILWRHALRPSSLTLLTVIGLNIGALIGGSVVIEAIFNLKGTGTVILDAVSRKQYITLQSGVAIIAIFYVVVNMLVDVLYSVLDPRVRRA